MKISKLGAAAMSAAILTAMLSLTAAGASGAGGAAEITAVSDAGAAPEASVTSDGAGGSDVSDTAGTSEDSGAPESPYSLPQYDIEAARTKNAAFVLTRAGNLDLYAVLGEDCGRLAKVRGIFGWTPAADTTVDYGWNGGAGLADTTLSDGKVWYQGAEFGTANANSGNFDRLAAIQTIIDITGNPIAALGRMDGDGAFIPGTVKIETWWVSQTSPYLLALIFEDESGETLASLEFPEQTAEWADAVTEAGGRETALSTLKNMLGAERFGLDVLNGLTAGENGGGNEQNSSPDISADRFPDSSADGAPAGNSGSGAPGDGETVPGAKEDIPAQTDITAGEPESAGNGTETAAVSGAEHSPDAPEQSGNTAEEPNPPTGAELALAGGAAAFAAGLAARKKSDRKSKR